MTQLPALTIWQPWATLIVAGAKLYEFRGWPAPRRFRGRRIALHAGARPVRPAEIRALRLKLRSDNETGLDAAVALPLLERWSQDPSALPVAAVIGTALLGEPRRACDVPAFAHRFPTPESRFEALWAWPLTDVRPLEPTLPARGAQGFWHCALPEFEEA